MAYATVICVNPSCSDSAFGPNPIVRRNKFIFIARGIESGFVNGLEWCNACHTNGLVVIDLSSRYTGQIIDEAETNPITIRNGENSNLLPLAIPFPFIPENPPPTFRLRPTPEPNRAFIHTAAHRPRFERTTRQGFALRGDIPALHSTVARRPTQTQATAVPQGFWDPVHVPRAIRHMGDLLLSVNDSHLMQDTCSICFDEKPIQELVTTICRHKFCLPCLLRWVNETNSRGDQNNTCPLCRVTIVQNI